MVRVRAWVRFPLWAPKARSQRFLHFVIECLAMTHEEWPPRGGKNYSGPKRHYSQEPEGQEPEELVISDPVVDWLLRVPDKDVLRQYGITLAMVRDWSLELIMGRVPMGWLYQDAQGLVEILCQDVGEVDQLRIQHTNQLLSAPEQLELFQEYVAQLAMMHVGAEAYQLKEKQLIRQRRR